MYCKYNLNLELVDILTNNSHKNTRMEVSTEELIEVINKLSRNKVVGVDWLTQQKIPHDQNRKQKKTIELLRKKLERLINEPQWPRYLGRAKIIPLSKDESALLEKNNIRLISILPTVTKLIEQIILNKLNPILYGKNSKIHRIQMGFKPGTVT